MTDIDFTTMTDQEIRDLREQCTSELTRRDVITYIPPQLEALNRDYNEAIGVVDGQEWIVPVGSESFPDSDTQPEPAMTEEYRPIAYPKGWTVTKDGKTWISHTDLNVWEPGVTGWTEFVEPPPEPIADPGWPFWVEGTKYAKFDQVTWPYENDAPHWVSTVQNNYSEPGTNTDWEQPE